MSRVLKALSVGLIASFIAGCVSSRVPEDAANMGVFFTFAPKHRCSDTSPKIRIGGAPKGTVKYRVKMVDLDMLKTKHGGGTVEAKGSIIPEGALDAYKGPCARDGSHVYNIEVHAIDGSGKVIGAGENSERF